MAGLTMVAFAGPAMKKANARTVAPVINLNPAIDNITKVYTPPDG